MHYSSAVPQKKTVNSGYFAKMVACYRVNFTLLGKDIKKTRVLHESDPQFNKMHGHILHTTPPSAPDLITSNFWAL
jgi:hypothetical protein